MKTILIRLAATLSCAAVSLTFPNAILQAVPKYRQEKSNWCWIATTKMVLDYHHRGAFMTQTQLIQNALNGLNLNDPGLLTGGTSIDKSVDMLLRDLKSLSSTYTGGVLSMADFANAIISSRPIFVGVSWVSPSPNGHLVLGIGFDTKDGSNNNIGPSPKNEITSVFYHDPADGLTGKKSFAALRQNSDWIWDQTLRLATNGPVPPVGIHDKVVIDNFTYAYYQPFTSKTAHATFISNEVPRDNCYSFNWSISFNHTSGEWPARSGTVSGTNQSTWTISPFTLPTGYSWALHPEGAVTGNLRVGCTDNGGYAHSDTKSVLFYPTGYYPLDVLYENKTTSTSQADVKAHNWIGLQYDNLNAGTNTKFRAGNAISILNGVTIGAGSVVQFSVEPGLR